MSTRREPWIFRLGLLGLLFLALTGWAVYRAARDVSPVVDRDYYSHGLRYNDTLVESRAAATLGWEVRVEQEERSVTFALTDRDGSPVTDAAVRALFPAGRDAAPLILPLIETAPGRYRLALPDTAAGLRTIDLSFERAGATLRRRFLLGT